MTAATSLPRLDLPLYCGEAQLGADIVAYPAFGFIGSLAPDNDPIAKVRRVEQKAAH